jgi:hypothetical protein
MREFRLCHCHEAVPVLATGRSHGGDPAETTFRAVVWQRLLTSSSLQILLELPSTYLGVGTIQVGKPQSGDGGRW